MNQKKKTYCFSLLFNKAVQQISFHFWVNMKHKRARQASTWWVLFIYSNYTVSKLRCNNNLILHEAPSPYLRVEIWFVRIYIYIKIHPVHNKKRLNFNVSRVETGLLNRQNNKRIKPAKWDTHNSKTNWGGVVTLPIGSIISLENKSTEILRQLFWILDKEESNQLFATITVIFLTNNVGKATADQNVKIEILMQSVKFYGFKRLH